MASDSLPALLVHQAAREIERDTLILHRRWEIEARAAVVSVLDTLARHPFELNPGDTGGFVTYEDVARALRALAARVREASRDD